MYSSNKFSEDLKYEIFLQKKLMRKCGKNCVKDGVGKMKRKTYFFPFFFKLSLNFRAHALLSELDKVSKSNFVKYWLQSMSSKIERAFKKRIKFPIKNRAKKDNNQATKKTH